MDFEYQEIYCSRRSNVFSRSGSVATSHPLATQVGIEVLRRRGNALSTLIISPVEYLKKPFARLVTAFPSKSV